jgi:hypothetical protein
VRCRAEQRRSCATSCKSSSYTHLFGKLNVGRVRGPTGAVVFERLLRRCLACLTADDDCSCPPCAPSADWALALAPTIRENSSAPTFDLRFDHHDNTGTNRQHTQGQSTSCTSSSILLTVPRWVSTISAPHSPSIQRLQTSKNPHQGFAPSATLPRHAIDWTYRGDYTCSLPGSMGVVLRMLLEQGLWEDEGTCVSGSRCEGHANHDANRHIFSHPRSNFRPTSLQSLDWTV